MSFLSSKVNIPILRNGWPYFILFFAANVLIAYGHLSLEFKLWVALFGLLLPFCAALAWLRVINPFSLGWKDAPSLPGWAWLLPLILGVSLRLVGLTSLSAWPVPDEGNLPFYAMEEIQDSKWSFFYGFSECPPVYPWISAVFYKFVPLSLPSLWLLPALFSVAGFLAGVWAARLWMPSFPAWIFSLFLSFNFWSLYSGRFNVGFVAVLLFELSAWVLLALALRAETEGNFRLWPVLLGICIGLGFWLSPSWAVIGLPPLLVFAKHFMNAGKQKIPALAAVMLPIFVFLAVFVYFAVTQDAGGHIRASLWKGTDHGLMRQIVNSFSYFTIPFWGHRSVGYYGPVWGGLLGACTGALVFLGWIYILKRKTPWNSWFYFLILGLGSLPGILTADCEMFRTIQWVPFLLAAATVGLMGLTAGVKKSLKFQLLVGLIVVCGFLETYHLFGPYHRIWGVPNGNWLNLKSVEFYKAYLILQKQSAKEGNGAVLFDLLPAVSDQTLVIASHPFDSAHNPRISFRNARWVAILANENYRPFLAKRFPESQWFQLSEGLPYPAGGGTLGIIPVLDKNTEDLSRFYEAELALHPAVSLVMHLKQNSRQDEILRELVSIYPSFQHDPFLESCYWEKTAYYYQKDRNDRASFNAVNQALKNGYPAAHLHYHRGNILLRLGHRQEALASFKAAINSPARCTFAQEKIDALSK